MNWSFADTIDPGAARTETYNALATGTKTTSYGAAGTYQTCASVYCHVQSPSPAWNTTIGDDGVPALPPEGPDGEHDEPASTPYGS